MEYLHGTWFEIKARCFDSAQRRIKANYAVEAMTWSEAEARALQGIREEFEDFMIDDIKKGAYQTIILVSDENVEEDKDYRFYKVKGNFQDVTPSGNPKKTPRTYLVEATSIQNAPKVLSSYLKETGNVLDYEQQSVQRTKIHNIIKRREE